MPTRSEIFQHVLVTASARFIWSDIYCSLPVRFNFINVWLPYLNRTVPDFESGFYAGLHLGDVFHILLDPSAFLFFSFLFIVSLPGTCPSSASALPSHTEVRGRQEELRCLTRARMTAVSDVDGVFHWYPCS